jgi:hypothetical protein
VHLHFQGMDAEQARQFTEAVEFHAPERTKISLRTSVDAGGGDAAALVGDLRNGRWNWSKADVTIDKAQIGSVRDSVDVHVQIAEAGGGSPLKLRFKLAFERAAEFTADMWAQAMDIVATWLRAIEQAQEHIDVMLATRHLMQDLKKIDPLIDHVEIRISRESREMISVKNSLAGEPDAVGN